MALFPMEIINYITVVVLCRGISTSGLYECEVLKSAVVVHARSGVRGLC